MKKLQGERTKRITLVPGVPVQAQIDDAGHIQAAFKADDGTEGYISFDSEVYTLPKLERDKIREKIKETSGVRPSFRESSENGTYRPLIVMTDKEGAITFGVGESSAVTLPVRLQIDSTVVLSQIPAYVVPEGEGYSDEDLDEDEGADEQEVIDAEAEQE